MATAVGPIQSRELEGRKVCIERFIYAIVCSVGVQFVLLTIFLLLVNFSLLYPIGWIIGSFRLVVSLSTWMWILPLISAVIVHGICLAKSYLAGVQYCPTRFQQIYRSIITKSALLVVNCVVGFLTAWFYTLFLRDDYRVLFLLKENGISVLNEKYLFLLLGGTFAGVYYFVRMQSEKTILSFPVAQQPRYLQIRSHLYSIIYRSLFKSFVPTLIYVSFYYTINCFYLRYKLANMFKDVTLAEESTLSALYSVLTDIRLVLYCWILSSQILSSMNLMQVFFHIFLTEYRQFPIEKPTMLNDSQMTLVEALACEKITVIQQLAALDLFTLAESCNSSRRANLYALSVPGGHPYNWRLVSGECIRLIKDYTIELAKSIEGATPKPAPDVVKLRPTASMEAEKLLMKQYNESFGIRSLASPVLPAKVPPQPDIISKTVDQHLDAIRQYFLNIPGIYYFFGEPKTAKTCYLLTMQSQQIVWITQALASLAAHSIHEDQFGVVQNDLPLIIRTLLQLKLVVDKVGSIQLDVKKIDRNYVALKTATKRSLYRIATAFADYLNDIVLEPSDMKALQGFVNYREV